MSGLILRLAGPLQAWGERSTFGERDTAAFPTRSGLIGLFEAARGHSRGHHLGAYDDFVFTVRIDRPGVPMVDFHTVGGGLPASCTVPTAAGKRRGEGAATIVSRRHYLADAAFTVAVTAPEHAAEELAAVTRALRAPHWAPYLGRRSCPPDFPLLLRAACDDPLGEILTRTPLARPAPRDGKDATADVVYETRPDGANDGETATELHDVPVSFHPVRRSYRPRRLWITPRYFPPELCVGGKLAPLLDYMETATT